MPQIAKDEELKPVTEGLISENVLSHYSTSANAVSWMENLNNDTLGVSRSRSFLQGLLTPGATVLSCTLFQSSNGDLKVWWQEGTSLKNDFVPTPLGVTTYAGVFGASTKARYDKIQGYLLMTGAGSALKYTNSGAPAALGTSFPTAVDLISAGFIGRIWCADSTDTTNKLYYSDVIPVAGVTATTGGASYLQINANNGDIITALVRTQQVLFVFTSNSIFRVYNTQSLDNSPVANVGTVSQEAVVKTKDGIYFYHPSGIYKLGGDGSVTEISKKISNLISGINVNEKASVVGWADNDHVYFSVGYQFDGGGGTDGKLTRVLRYTISTQVWTVYSFFEFLTSCAANEYSRIVTMPGTGNKPPSPYTVIFGTGITSTSTKYAAAFNDTDVVNNGDFSGTIPTYILKKTNWINWGKENHSKLISGISFPVENGAGLKVSYQIDNDPENEYRPIGTIGSNFVTYFKDFKSVPFNRIKFIISGTNISTTLKIGEPTMLMVEDLGYPNR